MDQDRINQIIDKYKGKAGSVIQVLLEIQRENKWLPAEVLETVSEKLGVPLSRIQQIVTFYKAFSVAPKGRHEIHVCQGTACHVRGSDMILDAISRTTGIEPGETSSDGKFSLERVACFGSCALAPVVVLDDKVYGRMTAAKTKKIIEDKK